MYGPYLDEVAVLRKRVLRSAMMVAVLLALSPAVDRAAAQSPVVTGPIVPVTRPTVAVTRYSDVVPKVDDNGSPLGLPVGRHQALWTSTVSGGDTTQRATRLTVQPTSAGTRGHRPDWAGGGDRPDGPRGPG
jgi:hypothetical protein